MNNEQCNFQADSFNYDADYETEFVSDPVIRQAIHEGIVLGHNGDGMPKLVQEMTAGELASMLSLN